VSGWTDEITKIAAEELGRLSPNFKYAVSCTIVQKKGAGVDVAATYVVEGIYAQQLL
jgi:hypothetical protein